MKDEFHIGVCRYMMCHNFTCSDILHTREINSFTRSSDVCDEYLTRLVLIEPTVQVVWYSLVFICRFSDFTVSILPTDFRQDSKLPHDTQNTFMIHRSPDKIKHLHVKTTIADFSLMTIMNTFQKEVVPHSRVLSEGKYYLYVRARHNNHCGSLQRAYIDLSRTDSTIVFIRQYRLPDSVQMPLVSVLRLSFESF